MTAVAVGWECPHASFGPLRPVKYFGAQSVKVIRGWKRMRPDGPRKRHTSSLGVPTRRYIWVRHNSKASMVSGQVLVSHFWNSPLLFSFSVVDVRRQNKQISHGNNGDHMFIFGGEKFDLCVLWCNIPARLSDSIETGVWCKFIFLYYLW